MKCLVHGCNFLLTKIPNASFQCEGDARKYRHAEEVPDVQHLHHSPDLKGIYPYLLVNIGSGVSILRVDGISTLSEFSNQAKAQISSIGSMAPQLAVALSGACVIC